MNFNWQKLWIKKPPIIGFQLLIRLQHFVVAAAEAAEAALLVKNGGILMESIDWPLAFSSSSTSPQIVHYFNISNHR